VSPKEFHIQQPKLLPNYFEKLPSKKLVLGSGAVLLVVVSMAIVISRLSQGSGLLSTPKVELSDKSFTVAVADEAKEQEKGLSGKNNLPKNRGMLFVFGKPDYYSFWMKDMKFPIDIIFINGDKVVKIYHNVPTPPQSGGLAVYQTPQPADRVLEINAGLSKKYNFKEGDKVKIENI